MDTYQTVKVRLLRLLEEHKLSIHKLAARSGVAPSTIKNILYGKSRNPGIVTLRLLTDGIGITLQDFFNDPAFEDAESEAK